MVRSKVVCYCALSRYRVGVALHEQAGGAGNAAYLRRLGAGGQRRLQPHGVIGLAVSHQTIVAASTKKVSALW